MSNHMSCDGPTVVTIPVTGYAYFYWPAGDAATSWPAGMPWIAMRSRLCVSGTCAQVPVRVKWSAGDAAASWPAGDALDCYA